MEEIEYALNWAAVIIPVIIILIQVAFTFFHDKTRDDKLHEWENELTQLSGKLQRGSIYYTEAIGLIDDVASNLVYVTDLFIEDAQFEKNDNNPQNTDMINQKLNDLRLARGKMGATLSNDLLMKFTEYTSFIGEKMESNAKNINIEEIKSKEIGMMIEFRSEKIQLLDKLFEGGSFTNLK